MHPDPPINITSSVKIQKVFHNDTAGFQGEWAIFPPIPIPKIPGQTYYGVLKWDKLDLNFSITSAPDCGEYLITEVRF